MDIGTIRRRQFVIAGAVAVACASFSATRAIAVTITGGTDTGTAGGNASGQSFNMGGDGNDGYDLLTAGSNLVTGGNFTGGAGGNASGGQTAIGGTGGIGFFFESTGAASLTITAGTFIGGAGGSASGASESNSSGVQGYAFSQDGVRASALTVIDGGSFQGNYDFELAGGTIELNGTFVGGPRTITGTYGTFSGLLADNTTSATYSYQIDGGEIILEPEPAACASLIVPAVMLIRRRKGTWIR